MIVVGLDVASHLGYAVLSVTPLHLKLLRKGTLYHPPEKNLKASDARRYLRYDLYRWSLWQAALLDVSVDHVFVEGYGYANAFTLGMLVELGTIVRSELHAHKLTWQEVPPATLKKFVTGKGNVKKNLMLLEVHKRFGITCEDDNEADAVSLAFYGAAALGYGHLTGVPRALLKTMKLDKLHSAA